LIKRVEQPTPLISPRSLPIHHNSTKTTIQLI
jgi:hypothetical protein